MKKIFFMAVSAVLLAAGCQKTEIQNEVLPKIGFDTHVGKLTKAPDAGNAGRYANLNEQGFMVWGYFVNENDLNYESGELYLKGIKVAADRGEDNQILTNNDGAAISWNTGNEVYYWPGKGKSLDIYCVSLYDGAEEGKTATNTYAKVSSDFQSQKLTVTDFVVDEDADNDLMVAPLINQHQDQDESIKPQFIHALTKVLVNFTTGSDKSKIYVISAKTTPLAHTGTLEVDNKSTEDKFINKLKWTLDAETKDSPYKSYEDQYASKIALEPTEITSLPEVYKSGVNAVMLKKGENVQFASWLLLPQEALTGTDLDVEYIVDGMYIKQRFNLAVGAVTSWDKNMQTTYNVKISPDYIEFLPSVDEWINDDIQDRGEFPVYDHSVTAKVGETEVTLYYNGDKLEVGTKVFVKSETTMTYESAGNATYTITVDETTTQTLTVAGGAVTAIA